VIEQNGEKESFITKLEVDIYYGDEYNPCAVIPKEVNYII